jgi:hypothetical protein
LRALSRLTAELPQDEVILYVDEVDIHLNPKIGPDWMLRSTQKTVWTPGKNEKRYLAGALNARTGRLTWVEGERKNSLLFIWQLWYLLNSKSSMPHDERTDGGGPLVSSKTQQGVETPVRHEKSGPPRITQGYLDEILLGGSC